METNNTFVLSLFPCNLPSNQLGFTGKVYVSKNTYSKYLAANHQKKPVQVTMKGYIFEVEPQAQVEDDKIALGKFPRTYMRVAFTDQVPVSLFVARGDVEYKLSFLEIQVVLAMSVSSKKLEVSDKELEKIIRDTYKNQFVGQGQVLLLEYGNNAFKLDINASQRMDLGIKGQTLSGVPGILNEETVIELKATNDEKFMLKGSGKSKQKTFIDKDFKFEDLGVGGLDKEIYDIFRRAFFSRRFPPDVLAKFGKSHAKGMLLYGPPGTGKTLIARQLAKALKAKEPKIVNGPEIFDKYVGEAERKVRELFSDAINDQKKYGDDSQLHIIIFDEFDAICKKRGTVSNAGVNDSVVNMLLSMIDGVNSLNNVLVIGMTNRKDMIDEAILRPGRFEIHVEVSLPDEAGRVQIFNIHTKTMRENKVLSEDVNVEKLAKMTKNYTGAEIEAVVKSAISHGLARNHGIMDFSKDVDIGDDFKVEHGDFVKALDEVKPQFGVDTDKFEALLRNKVLDFGHRFKKNQELMLNLINQIKYGNNSQLISVLLEGENGCGKSAFSSWAALESDFPFVKLISAEDFVGLHEVSKVDAIVKVFNDAYRSDKSLIVLDDIERIIEYVNIGPRFSNNILQALMVLIKKIPTKENHRLMIVGTTSQKTVLKELEVYQCFDV